MRLGAYPCTIQKGTKAYMAYKRELVTERHRHRYEINNKFRKRLSKAGLVFSGTFVNNDLVEIIELSDHPWFLATQFHPEFKSRPLTPHLLFRGFVKACLNYMKSHRNLKRMM